MNRKQIVAAMLALAAGVGLVTACTDKDVVNSNLAKDADNFKVNRRVSFYNGITDKVMMVVEGFCSVDIEPTVLKVTCKVGPDSYKRNYLGRSDNVTFIIEQLDGANVSADHYKLVLKPEALIPGIEIR